MKVAMNWRGDVSGQAPIVPPIGKELTHYGVHEIPLHRMLRRAGRPYLLQNQTGQELFGELVLPLRTSLRLIHKLFTPQDIRRPAYRVLLTRRG